MRVLMVLATAFAIANSTLSDVAVRAADDKSASVPLTEEEAEKAAIDAYIFGYPLVTMELTRKVMTNTVTAQGVHAPMGQFVLMRKYPDASFKDVTAPNADTLYSSAWIDLSNGPFVLSTPDEGDRYFLMPLLSGWTDVFAVPGKRTTGTKAQTYAITGPGWQGAIPEGLTQLKSPTNMVWILGRTYCTGTPEDYKACHALMDKYRLVPLESYGKPFTPPSGKVDPTVDMKTPVREQVNKMGAVEYFKLLSKLMRENPPSKDDAEIIGRISKIGIVPGQPFDPSKLSAKVSERVPRLAQERIMEHFKSAGSNLNGWVFTTKTGLYGTDYLQRALITAIGLGANRPQDAVYPTSEVDGEGKPYSGAYKYTLTFAKGQVPPAQGFWSLTMYNGNYFFVANPLSKYTVSPRNDFTYNADGSLTIYIQNDSPGADKEANWLPAPKDKFILMLRLYWPKETDPSILDGTWVPPAVKRVE